MEMTTFCRSKPACASYSMLTYESPPLTLGQQLIVSGTRASSLVCGGGGGAPSEYRVRVRVG